MAFMRADTSATMASQAWSTTEMGDGLKKILQDGNMDLPDDLSSLKDPLCFVSSVCRYTFAFTNVSTSVGVGMVDELCCRFKRPYPLVMKLVVVALSCMLVPWNASKTPMFQPLYTLIPGSLLMARQQDLEQQLADMEACAEADWTSACRTLQPCADYS